MKGPLDMHSRYRELIAARLDGPLTRPELRALTSHLRTCATCREVDREYREQRYMLRSLPSSIPPRDLWARTSGALDREVARGSYRRPRYGRAFLERRRRGTPSTAVLTTLAAVGLTAAIAVLQLAPVPSNLPSPAPATPFAVRPQPLAFIGAGSSDITIYRTQVTHVCPPSAADCAVDEPIEQTAVLLPGKMRPRNVALSPSGARLAFVGQQQGEDMIAVVTLPSAHSAGPGIDPLDTSAPSNGNPTTPAESEDPPASTGNEPGSTALSSSQPGATSGAGAPTEPPASAVAGMTVVAILDNVHSAGAPPAWSADGETLAFSAMPADGRHGPDVYVWSVGDDEAQPLTNDHSSYFASWSGRRIVASRFVPADDVSETSRIRTVVIDPISQEERRVELGAVWLPLVNPGRTHALVWSGDLELTNGLPVPRTGALYLVDWSGVDPFADGAPTPTPEPEPETPAPSTSPPPEPTPEPSPEPSGDPTPEPSAEPSPEPTADPTPGPSNGPTAEPTDAPNPSTGLEGSGSTLTTQKSDQLIAQPGAEPADPPAAHATPSAAPPEATPAATPAEVPSTPSQASATPPITEVPGALVAVEPERDPSNDPVRDWQAQWSLDGQVVGIWIADAAGSTWGRLVVLALDVRSELGLHPDPLLSATLARRGFSLGLNRVAWVAPSDTDPEGELRVRTWGSDGVGDSVQQLDGEEVVPAF